MDIKVPCRGHNSHFKDEEAEVLRGKVAGLAGQWQSGARVSRACSAGREEGTQENKPVLA